MARFKIFAEWGIFLDCATDKSDVGWWLLFFYKQGQTKYALGSVQVLIEIPWSWICSILSTSINSSSHNWFSLSETTSSYLLLSALQYNWTLPVSLLL